MKRVVALVKTSICFVKEWETLIPQNEEVLERGSLVWVGRPSTCWLNGTSQVALPFNYEEVGVRFVLAKDVGLWPEEEMDLWTNACSYEF